MSIIKELFKEIEKADDGTLKGLEFSAKDGNYEIVFIRESYSVKLYDLTISKLLWLIKTYCQVNINIDELALSKIEDEIKNTKNPNTMDITWTKTKKNII